ncbi:MAG: hypothetical protein RL021_2124 [Bacteroidota bacterium]
MNTFNRRLFNLFRVRYLYRVEHFDHIVIGTGTMGAATCYHLAKQGKHVLGIDRFSPPHENGSHGGHTRIIRKAYFEHPDYIPLLERAYVNWKDLERETGRQLYFETGLLYGGLKENQILKNVKAAAAEYGIPLERLRHNPAGVFRLPSDYELLFEPEAGFLLSDVAIGAFLEQAERKGARLLNDTEVLSWRQQGDRIEVVTNEGIFTADRLVLTAGVWTDRLLEGVGSKLQVTRQVLAWFDTGGRDIYRMGHLPCWLMADEQSTGAFYGFPEDPEHPTGIKVALHHPDAVTDPDAVDRTVTDSDLRTLRKFVARHLPGIPGTLREVKTCLYENSPDGDFVIDRLKGMEDRVCYAWGFSGHGFKFAAVIGELLAELSIHGRTQLPIGFLSSNRF